MLQAGGPVSGPGRRILHLVLLLLLAASAVVANVEKIAFIGPALESEESPLFGLDRLRLLTPEHAAVRTLINRTSPRPEPPPAIEDDDADVDKEAPAPDPRPSAWFLVDGLAAGVKYELRICWAAIDPTSFSMELYELSTMRQRPDLMGSLNAHLDSLARAGRPGKRSSEKPQSLMPSDGTRQSRLLLLHVRAAADYFTDRKDLMKEAPPVLVDVILDPYVFNLLPQSLILTAGYIILIVFVTGFVSHWIASSLRSVPTPHSRREKSD